MSFTHQQHVTFASSLRDAGASKAKKQRRVNYRRERSGMESRISHRFFHNFRYIAAPHAGVAAPAAPITVARGYMPRTPAVGLPAVGGGDFFPFVPSYRSPEPKQQGLESKSPSSLAADAAALRRLADLERRIKAIEAHSPEQPAQAQARSPAASPARAGKASQATSGTRGFSCGWAGIRPTTLDFSIAWTFWEMRSLLLPLSRHPARAHGS